LFSYQIPGEDEEAPETEHPTEERKEDEYQSVIQPPAEGTSVDSPPPPKITIDGRRVIVSWNSYKQWGLTENDTYKVWLLNKDQEFHEIECDNIEGGLINDGLA